MVNGSRVLHVKNLLRSRDIEYEVVTNDIFSSQYAMGTSPKRVRSPDPRRIRIQLPTGTVLLFASIYFIPCLLLARFYYPRPRNSVDLDLICGI